MHGSTGQIAGAVKSKRLPRIVGRERWDPIPQAWKPWVRRPVKDPEKAKRGDEDGPEGSDEKSSNGVGLINNPASVFTPSHVCPSFGNLSTDYQDETLGKETHLSYVLAVPAHKSKDRRSRIKRFTSQLTPAHLAALDTDAVLARLNDLRRLERHIKPIEGWRKGTWPDHTGLRHIWVGKIRVMKELMTRGALEKVVKQGDFDPIILSLLHYSPSLRRSANSQGTSPILDDAQERTMEPTKLDLPSILRFMSNINIRPSNYQLEQIASSRSTQLLRPIDHAQHHRSRLSLTHSHLGSTALRLWSERRKIVESTLALYPDFINTELYEQEISQSMDEVDILTLGRYDDDVIESLRQGMDFWMEHRDKLVVRKRKALQDYVRRWVDLGMGDELEIRPDETETKNLCLLLRDCLLSKRIQPTTSYQKSAEAPDLTDPFDVLRLLLGATCLRQRGDFHYNTRAVVSSVIRMRNAFYLAHDNPSLLKLVRLISPPLDPQLLDGGSLNHSLSDFGSAPTPHFFHLLPPPPLPSSIHATLLCAAHTPLNMRHLLVRLYHLPRPLTPVRLGKKTRQYLRNLALRADERDWASWRRSADPFTEPRDQEACAIVDTAGWMGLLEHLFQQWGEGMSVRQWKRVVATTWRERSKGQAEGEADVVKGHIDTHSTETINLDSEHDLQARLRDVDLARSVTRPRNILERPVEGASRYDQVYPGPI